MLSSETRPLAVELNCLVKFLCYVVSRLSACADGARIIATSAAKTAPLAFSWLVRSPDMTTLLSRFRRKQTRGVSAARPI